VLFFPAFDPAYILFSCALVGLWHLAVERQRPRFAVAFGLVLAAATFCSYLLLALGPFLALEGIFCTAHRWRRALGITLRQGLIAVGVTVMAYGVLWAFTSFDPIRTFCQAWTNQQRFLAEQRLYIGDWRADRTYPQTIPWDLSDFLLASGWISLPLVVMALARTLRDRAYGNGRGNQHLACGSPRRRQQRILILLCIGQPVFVALTGLIQAETARVWLFMLPLWLLPVGLELRDWSWLDRLVTLGCVWLILAAVAHNMVMLGV
jgi:hypothetical protein